MGAFFWGGQVVSDRAVVEDLLYHLELAWAAYAKDAAGAARRSMLRERNIVKFVGKAGVMQPAYYIALDPSRRLVVMGVRGTQSVHDLVTDLAPHSESGQGLGGAFGHFGSVEAARWLAAQESATLRDLLSKHPGYDLRLVGHSLGGSTASLLAAMLRANTHRTLGTTPERISAITFATPPCASRELADSMTPYVTTVVNQDDAVPRMSTAALDRLRSEILSTDWSGTLRETLAKTEGTADLANRVESLIDRYSMLRERFMPSSSPCQNDIRSLPQPTGPTNGQGSSLSLSLSSSFPLSSSSVKSLQALVEASLRSVSNLGGDGSIGGGEQRGGNGVVNGCTGEGETTEKYHELYTPGLLYHIVRPECLPPVEKDPCMAREEESARWISRGMRMNRDFGSSKERSSSEGEGERGCGSEEDRALVRASGGARFGRIVLSGSMLGDHRVESYFYSLREVLKGF